MKNLRVCVFQRSNIMLPVVTVCAAVSIIAQNTNSFSLSEKDLGYQHTCLPTYKVFPSKQVLYSELSHGVCVIVQGKPGQDV